MSKLKDHHFFCFLLFLVGWGTLAFLIESNNKPFLTFRDNFGKTPTQRGHFNRWLRFATLFLQHLVDLSTVKKFPGIWTFFISSTASDDGVFNQAQKRLPPIAKVLAELRSLSIQSSHRYALRVSFASSITLYIHYCSTLYLLFTCHTRHFPLFGVHTPLPSTLCLPT